MDSKLDDLYELCDFLSRDVKEMNKKIRENGGKITETMIAYVDRLTHALKSTKTTIAMIEEHENGGYSSRGNSYARGDATGRVHWNDGTVSYGDNNMMSYNDGSSYARGRGANAKRDSMGRYSGNESYNDGYSGDRRQIVTQLHELMKDADPNMRGEFQSFINRLENM